MHRPGHSPLTRGSFSVQILFGTLVSPLAQWVTQRLHLLLSVQPTITLLGLWLKVLDVQRDCGIPAPSLCVRCLAVLFDEERGRLVRERDHVFWRQVQSGCVLSTVRRLRAAVQPGRHQTVLILRACDLRERRHVRRGYAHKRKLRAVTV